MNYLAHGYLHLGRPRFVAGTALPEWMRAAGLRLPRRQVRSSTTLHDFAAREARGMAEFDAGIACHLEADRRFHGSRVFVGLCERWSARLRTLAPENPRFRASFIAHVLVEVLLDASIEEARPGTIARYYEVLRSVEPLEIAAWIERTIAVPARPTTEVFERFLELRFLEDYLDDERLFVRLEAILGRVGLGSLPRGAAAFLPSARIDVRTHAVALIDAAYADSPNVGQLPSAFLAVEWHRS
jgi:hypothetical protein